MIHAKLPLNTKYLYFDNKVYCAYCGKEIQADTEIDHYETTEYYHCDCNDARHEIDLIRQIQKKKEELKQIKNELSELEKAKNTIPVKYEVKQVIAKVN